MPSIYGEWWNRWIELHPGWEKQTWREEELDRFGLVNRKLYDDAESITPSPWQFRSDLARYEILHRLGGVYIDCDTEPLKSLEPLLAHGAFAAWEIPNRYIGNSVLGSTANHEAFGRLIEALPESAAMNRGQSPTRISGPQFLTRVWADAPVAIFPQETFYPYRWNELHRAAERPPEASYARHHFAHQRQKRGVPL